MSEALPNNLGDIFQRGCLITFVDSTPQQTEGVSCAVFTNRRLERWAAIVPLARLGEPNHGDQSLLIYQ